MFHWVDISTWSWQELVIAKILVGSFLASYLFRLLGDAPARERIRRITVQYFWSVIFALTLALLIWGHIPYSSVALGIFAVGLLQPFGGFFQWRAAVWSLSRVPIFMAMASIIPLLLSAALLGEWHVFFGNISFLLGFSLAVIGVVLHFRQEARGQQSGDSPIAVPVAFYGYAAIFTVVFGIGTFAWNYWAKSGVPIAELMAFWYTGALCGAILFLLTLRIRGIQDPPQPLAMASGKKHMLIVFAGLSIVLNLVFAFLTLQKVEQVVVLPLFALGDIIGPVLIGMFIFHEWKQVRGIGWLYLAIALVGAIMIALSH